MRVRGGGQQSPAKEAKEDRESRGGGGELELGCVEVERERNLCEFMG